MLNRLNFNLIIIHKLEKLPIAPSISTDSFVNFTGSI